MDTFEEVFAWHMPGEPPTGECWEWTGWLTGDARRGRYGCIRITHAGVRITAHRASYLIHKGPIPEGGCILHSCDNTACVNPHHLELGSNADNSRQMAERGRTGTRKLTPDIVHIIRQSSLSNHELGEQYGVTRQAIRAVRAHKTWKHI